MAQETSDGVPISDGFDFPVGPRGEDVDVFKTHKIDTVLVDPDYFTNFSAWHPGEDWNGKGGGDTDLGDPIYAVSNGKVVEFGHYSVWGNIVLLEHALPDGLRTWSQYAHLDTILVNQVGQKVTRGQQIGTMGKGDNNRYLAHLHFEIRKNKLSIGNWTPMVKDKNVVLANYYAPTDFIKSHRPGSLAVPEPKPADKQVPTTAQAQPSQIVVDTRQNQAGGSFRASQTTVWNQAQGGFQGNMLWVPASAQQETHIGEWHPALPAAGVWEVWIFIPANNATTSYAGYTVVHADGQSGIAVNQGGNAGKWENLGAFRFGATGGYVRLNNITGELTGGSAHKVAFDAVCWTKVG